MNSTETEVYQANCHCGQVRLTVTLPNLLLTRVNRCNCSVCTRQGYLLTYPKREDVSFVSGEDKLSEYRFGNKTKSHRFCPTCGTSMFIDFSESNREAERGHIALNIRIIENIEDILPQIQFRDVDGKNKLGPPYQNS